MASKTNKDKTPEIDESVLDETPPNINEPQKPEDPEPQDTTELVEKEDETETTELVDDTEQEISEKPEKIEETQEEKDKRYRSQQTEAQIQAAKSRALAEKVQTAASLGEPTTEELQTFVSTRGANWDELTNFEQVLAKDAYINSKRFNLINDAVEENTKIDEWANKIDTFIESTDSKPQYVALSSHEDEFRKFCMEKSHRGTPIDVLLSSFLYNLPAPKKIRGSLLEKAGGGEKDTVSGKITDADAAAQLRITNPREYKRQLKLGNIVLDA